MSEGTRRCSREWQMMTSPISVPIANHNRWHLARGLSNPRCALCTAKPHGLRLMILMLASSVECQLPIIRTFAAPAFLLSHAPVIS
jgi:hypothetical protein